METLDYGHIASGWLNKLEEKKMSCLIQANLRTCAEVVRRKSCTNEVNVCTSGWKVNDIGKVSRHICEQM
jgi:hypothetical protein